MTYQEMMAKMKANKRNMGNIPVSRAWNYAEPYKVIVIDFVEQEESQVEVTIAFKAGGKIVEKTFQFHTEGKAAHFWNEFIDNAFPEADNRTWDEVLGRPFSAEIVKNDKFENLHILSGYKGDYPAEVEGLE